MTKILSGAAYLALKEKADNYDAVVNSIVASNEGLKAEDVTLETIQTAITTEVDESVTANANRITELEGTVSTLTTEKTELESTVVTLTAEKEELMKLPGAESVIAIPELDSNPDEGADTMLAFAEKHKGDTMAIAAEMRKRNLN